MSKFNVGNRVLYYGAWNTEPGKPCTITKVGNTKNGRPVYGNSLGHWGYENQYVNQPGIAIA